MSEGTNEEKETNLLKSGANWNGREKNRGCERTRSTERGKEEVARKERTDCREKEREK